MGTLSGTNYISDYSGDAIDAALAAAQASAGVTGIVTGAGDGTYTNTPIDIAPTLSSTNLITSGAVYASLATVARNTYTDTGGGNIVIS